MRTHSVVIFIVLLFIISSIPHACSFTLNSGGSTLEPFDEDRFNLPADIGDNAKLMYEVNQSPIECALYLLKDNEQSDQIDLLDLNSLSRIYYRTSLNDEVEFTVSHEGGFLLVVWNNANITQTFYYEWLRINADEEIRQVITLSVIPVILFLSCLVVLLLLRRRHKQLLAKEMQ